MSRNGDLGAPRPSKTSGYSLIELMIAASIFLILVVGVLPLFTSSIRTNLAGREATDTANFGRSRIEQLFQLQFSKPELEVPAGANQSEVQEHWSEKDKIWKAGAVPAAGDTALWTRTTFVRQYSVTDLADDGVFDEPLSGDTSAGQVHIKELEVLVRSNRSQDGPFGNLWQTRLRMLKAK